MAKEKEIKLSDVLAKGVEAGFLMAMTPQEREGLVQAGFDYTKRTRRMPTLSDACIEYMNEKQQERDIQKE